MNTRHRIQCHTKYLVISALLLFLACCANAQAAPMAEKDLPASLRDWTQWVSKGHESKDCPYLFNQWQTRYCAWPGRLKLDLDNSGGSFSQSWRIYHDSWITLPGNNKTWPQQVSLNNKAALLVERQGLPMLFLKAGEYQVQGRYYWQQPPTTLPLPGYTGIVVLRLNGKNIEFPRREHGALWLQSVQSTKSVNQFSFQVYRHIDDSIPARISFHLSLQVSGVARQESIQLPVDEAFTPLHLDSRLPARLDNQNKLTLQVRPGNWDLNLVFRYSGNLTELGFEKPKSAWVDEEVWVFQSQPSLRIVDVTGMDSIDPQQTELPETWKHLPAYRAVPGSALHFKEERRGDPNPGDDQLQLQRDMWLSFDGTSYTLLDKISGSKKTHWRMEMAAPIKLGQVSIDGRDQFITRLQDSDRAGVEIREGQINLQATSELIQDGNKIPASGWGQDFNRVNSSLHLPPGYRVFAVSGADAASSTWVTRWTLLDIFLVLLITIAAAKLRGKLTASIAFFTLVLTYHESEAPVILWLLLIIGFALLSVLKSGRLHKLSLVYHYAISIALLVAVVPFLIFQIRASIYPQLDRPAQYSYSIPEQYAGFNGEPLNKPVPEESVAEEPLTREMDELERRPAKKERRKLPSSISAFAPPAPARSQSWAANLESKIVRYDPQAVKQTGPGLPQWHWRTVDIRWNGPVEKNQQINIFYLTPAMNFILAWLRVFLVIALLLGLFQFNVKTRRFSFKNATLGAMLFAVALSATILPGTAQAQAYPDKELLQEMENRLFEQAECLPRCADIADMQIILNAQQLQVDMTVNNLDLTAIPLPGDPNRWHIDSISVDGKRLDAVYAASNQRLFIALPKGHHKISIDGRVSADNKQQFEMPLKPHKVSIKSQAWEVAGIHPDGSVDDQLQFSRAEKNAEKVEFNSSQLPLFVSVERKLIFGLNWTVQTRVQRISAPGSAIVLDIPLIEGESVITPDIKVEGHAVKLNMAADQINVSWESKLAMSDAKDQARRQIKLLAAKTTQWTEKWEIDVSPIWHLQYEGVPVIRHEYGNSWRPAWRPWPGEALTLNIMRPQGIAGQNLTIDNSELRLSPGQRLTDATLHLSIRSSQGAKHTIQLPPGAKLQQVQSNDKILPLRLDQNKLTLPIEPGKQQIEIQFQVASGISPHYQSSLVDLGIPSVNHEIKVTLPADRWILFVRGPVLGPAVLIWGVLIVILLLAFPLSHLQKSIPLKYWQWGLLILGLLPISLIGLFIVIAWFLLVNYRATIAADCKKWRFNVLQLALLAMTLATVVTLGATISTGLLGSPDMQVSGHGSYSFSLNWYQDIAAAQLPTADIYSLPMYFYRIFMLLWALWLAFSVVKWSQWGWRAFSNHGYWRSIELSRSTKVKNSDANK